MGGTSGGKKIKISLCMDEQRVHTSSPNASLILSTFNVSGSTSYSPKELFPFFTDLRERKVLSLPIEECRSTVIDIFNEKSFFSRLISRPQAQADQTQGKMERMEGNSGTAKKGGRIVTPGWPYEINTPLYTN